MAAYSWAEHHSRTTSLLDFTARRAWLLAPLAAAGAGAAFAVSGASAVIVAGAAAGLAVAMLIGMALERRGRVVHDAGELQAFAGLATLAEIGRFRAVIGSAYPARRDREVLEGYQGLIENLRGRLPAGGKALLITSASPEEGKSTTAANLATLLAEQGKRTVLVDADLRWSSLRSSLGGPSSLGLTGLLLNRLHSPSLALARTGEENLQLLPAGAAPDKPEALLRSPRLLDVIESLRQMADYVVVDSPPILEAPDAVMLAARVDATLLVVRSGKTRSTPLRRALEALAAAEVRPIGAVLNRARLQPVNREAEARDAHELEAASGKAPAEAGAAVPLPASPYAAASASVREVGAPDVRFEQLNAVASSQLETAVGELLVDLEATLALIRSLKKEAAR